MLEGRGDAQRQLIRRYARLLRMEQAAARLPWSGRRPGYSPEGEPAPASPSTATRSGAGDPVADETLA